MGSFIRAKHNEGDLVYHMNVELVVKNPSGACEEIPNFFARMKTKVKNKVLDLLLEKPVEEEEKQPRTSAAGPF